MIGTVLHFSVANGPEPAGGLGSGVIRGEDGARYRFSEADWASPGHAMAGDVVDFDPKDGVATEIYVTSRHTLADTEMPLAASSEAPKTSDVAAPAEFDDAIVSPKLGMNTATASTAIAAPSGRGARFFIAYLIAMIPTYILPYMGSNSMVVGGISIEAGGGLPPLYIWHMTCFAVLIALAYVRGSRIQRQWLAAFPIIAGIFDLVAGLNFIPFVPTIMHAAALYVGASRKPNDDFDDTSSLSAVKWAYTGLAVFSLWATWKCMTSAWNSADSSVALAILPLAVLIVSAFLTFRLHKGFSGNISEAWQSVTDGSAAKMFSNDLPPSTASIGSATQNTDQFCSECGAGNEAAAKFCEDCGSQL